MVVKGIHCHKSCADAKDVNKNFNKILGKKCVEEDLEVSCKKKCCLVQPSQSRSDFLVR